MRSDQSKAEPFSECSSRPLRRVASVQSLNSVFSHLSSSTMTASDLPGPGRILDKYVFTRGGRALERAIARAAHSLGFGPAAAALRIGANLRGFSLDEAPLM
ncbi:uncharacterized protein FOMMEDRAFT_152633 [Fomitiporia mediterranea MF3/22]|uniref:uncharacterized protein n=1 Tax=Fomitiporia mediterranea (strain MF3/22) TaxID=694068 RepID=UPI00044083EA|nr:uncharacterized protein FOMMEDRAFT_152633 [Fomitiporia mediterranea MF3/22]EJD05336.1 hypothetical protein FOMMEDRAFT_152633 [Fomitiporia mediterranea MF3/22]